LLWYVGALLSAGATGALLGSGLMDAFGVSSGWVVFAVAAVCGVLAFIIAFKIALPVYIVIVNTAFVGAGAVVTGVLLLFNQLDRSDLGYGVAWGVIEASWFWLIAWIVLAGLGLGAQLRTIASVHLPADPWTEASPA
jgi:hypothetical protein